MAEAAEKVPFSRTLRRFLRTYRFRFSAILLAIGILLVVLAVGNFTPAFQHPAVPVDQQRDRPVVDRGPNYNLVFVVAGPIVVLVGAYLVGAYYIARARFEHLMLTKSKAEFLRNLPDLEDLLWDLTPADEQRYDRRRRPNSASGARARARRSVRGLCSHAGSALPWRRPPARAVEEGVPVPPARRSRKSSGPSRRSTGRPRAPSASRRSRRPSNGPSRTTAASSSGRSRRSTWPASPSGSSGWDGEKLYLYSQRTAVRPEYQNHRLGFRLKTHQRDEVLRQGLDEIRWTFDPLQSRTAFLHVHRLGRGPGQVPRPLLRPSRRGGRRGDRDRPTSGPSGSCRTRRSSPGSEAKAPDRAADERRFGESTPLVETELDEHGLRVPTSVQEPSLPSASLEIPFDLGLVREHSPKNLRTWRHAVRDAFRAAFDLGYAVDDFAVVAPDHERRSVYFLRRNPHRLLRPDRPPCTAGRRPIGP